MGSSAKKIREVDGLVILPDNTRVFVRDAFLFGDIRSRSCRVKGWNMNVEAQEWLGTPELEYYLELPDGRLSWVSAMHIEGYILGL